MQLFLQQTRKGLGLRGLRGEKKMDRLMLYRSQQGLFDKDVDIGLKKIGAMQNVKNAIQIQQA